MGLIQTGHLPRLDLELGPVDVVHHPSVLLPQQVGCKRQLVRGALHNMHEISGGVGERNKVFSGHSRRKFKAAAQQKFLLDAVGTDKEGTGAGPLPAGTCRVDEYGINQKVSRCGTALCSVHVQTHQRNPVAAVLGEGHLGEGESATIEQ